MSHNKFRQWLDLFTLLDSPEIYSIPQLTAYVTSPISRITQKFFILCLMKVIQLYESMPSIFDDCYLICMFNYVPDKEVLCLWNMYKLTILHKLWYTNRILLCFGNLRYLKLCWISFSSFMYDYRMHYIAERMSSLLVQPLKKHEDS